MNCKPQTKKVFHTVNLKSKSEKLSTFRHLIVRKKLKINAAI
jgi:hypothetical protein